MNKTPFLQTLFGAVAVLCAIGIGLLSFTARSNPTRRIVACSGAAALLLFALGAAGWDLFGLSGCGPHATAGVTWDWPW